MISYTFLITLFFSALLVVYTFYLYDAVNNNDNIHLYKSSDCPDFWRSDLSGNCYFPVQKNNMIINTGTLQSLQKTNNKAPYSVDGISFSNKNKLWTSESQSAICAQREWALKHHIVWDGVSNYNQCI